MTTYLAAEAGFGEKENESCSHEPDTQRISSSITTTWFTQQDMRARNTPPIFRTHVKYTRQTKLLTGILGATAWACRCRIFPGGVSVDAV